MNFFAVSVFQNEYLLTIIFSVNCVCFRMDKIPNRKSVDIDLLKFQFNVLISIEINLFHFKRNKDMLVISMLELTFCTSYIKNHKESAIKCYEKKSNKESQKCHKTDLFQRNPPPPPHTHTHTYVILLKKD